MIEPMKKLTLLVHHRRRDDVLWRLQALGVVDVEAQPPASETYRHLKALRDRCAKATDELRRVHAEVRSADKSVCAPNGTEGMLWPPEVRTAHDRVEYLETRFETRDGLVEGLKELRQRRDQLRPWGDFDVGRIDRLVDAGVQVRFFIGSERVFDNHDFADLALAVVNREQGRVYFLLFEHNSRPHVLPFQELPVPRASLSEVEEDIRMAQQRVERENQELCQFEAELPEMEAEIASLESQMQYESVQRSLGVHASETIYYATGWYPAKQGAQIKAFLEEQGVSYQIENPGPGDVVPVKLRNQGAAKLFEPITRIFSLPSYFELDPTVFFAPFFTIFFGLCLGDVGYGAILTGLAGLAFFKAAPHWRGICVLGVLLGVATIGSGVLLNSVFGHPLFDLPGDNAGVLAEGGNAALFAARTVDGRTVFPAMTLSLLLGFVQLVVGIVLQGVNAFRQRGLAFAVKPASMLVMLLGAVVMAVHADFLGLGFNAALQVGPMPVGAWVAAVPADVGRGLVVLGLMVFFLFGEPGHRFWVRPLVGLWGFYQFLTGLLGDFLSYIRLFALGLASGLLGNAFNNIAFMVLPQQGGEPVYLTPWIVITGVILVLGHGLNLGLSMLGAFVHPLRLTFVEFYKNMQFMGGGRDYRPFALPKHATSD